MTGPWIEDDRGRRPASEVKHEVPGEFVAWHRADYRCGLCPERDLPELPFGEYRILFLGQPARR